MSITLTITSPQTTDSDILIAIIANTLSVSTTQITVTQQQDNTTYIILIAGTDEQLDMAEREVNQNLENAIESKTNGDVTIVKVYRTDSQHKEENESNVMVYLVIVIVLILFFITIFVALRYRKRVRIFKKRENELVSVVQKEKGEPELDMANEEVFNDIKDDDSVKVLFGHFASETK
eukprot:196168_1